MIFHELMAEDLLRLAPYFGLRPNKSCDSAPLCSFLFKFFYMVKYSEQNGALFLNYFDEEPNMVYGFIPYCPEEKLAENFKLEEAYFNQQLGLPLVIYSADEEGVRCLQEAGALDNYSVTEVQDLRDYLYEGDALRSLTGRKFSKKRNHINKFLASFEGRWEYRTLGWEDREDVKSYLQGWMERKHQTEIGPGTNEEGEVFDAFEELEGEYRGICGLLETPEAFGYMKIGGIYIDGKLSAFSIGVKSEAESMAIIDVEKAYSDVDGLYQMINREFLRHEFPDVALVNREDDVGMAGLRQAKLSYFPCGYENKYILKQTDFTR